MRNINLSTGIALLALLCTACGGGGGSTGASSVPSGQSVQRVSGTLTIGTAPSGTSNRSRKPLYVSAATTHAYVFINGSATPNNAVSTCSGPGTNGTGTACTLSWTASLAVPAAYTFAVETDNGTNVLAEGSNSYAIVAGTNTLGTLTLNGVVAKASFATTSCSNSPLPGNCNGNVTLEDFAGDTIEYLGATTVPTGGTSPTTGTIFDNGSVTFAASAASGLVIGTAQTAGPDTFSTYAANVLTASGVINATGHYTYEVQCATATTTGTFGITVGGGTTPSGIITGAELTSIGTTYPASVTTVATAPSYSCATGAISSANGTLPIN